MKTEIMGKEVTKMKRVRARTNAKNSPRMVHFRGCGKVFQLIIWPFRQSLREVSLYVSFKRTSNVDFQVSARSTVPIWDDGILQKAFCRSVHGKLILDLSA